MLKRIVLFFVLVLNLDLIQAKPGVLQSCLQACCPCLGSKKKPKPDHHKYVTVKLSSPIMRISVDDDQANKSYYDRFKERIAGRQKKN